MWATRRGPQVQRSTCFFPPFISKMEIIVIQTHSAYHKNASFHISKHQQLLEFEEILFCVYIPLSKKYHLFNSYFIQGLITTYLEVRSKPVMKHLQNTSNAYAPHIQPAQCNKILLNPKEEVLAKTNWGRKGEVPTLQQCRFWKAPCNRLSEYPTS